MENKFEYTYSAPKNAEIEKIRKKYAPQTSAESKLEQIKKLDSSVESEAVGCALGIGIPGSLILGLGMSCCMVWTDLFILGIIVGIIGMIMCGAAYPIYKNTIKKKRAEIAPQILKLSEEIERGIRN
ncbi:MAG: hypothetical protein IJC04_05950 [Oscillospiraceae bacterium]|nr:hypothetical protein [Oscillospiraceae bacterium]